MASIMKRMMMRGAGIALMLLMATTAWAETINDVKYIDENGEEKTANNVTVLTGNETTLGTAGNKETPTEAWYIAKGNLSYDHELNNAKFCNIHLILEDGCNMSVGTEESPITGNHAIYIKSANLTIYGQSTGDNMGRLTAISNNKDGIFIQSDPAFGVFLTINGGQVTAKGGWAIDAEITQTDYSNPLTGGITINGGKVTANGAERGICASANHSSAKAILTINGGEVCATNSAEDIPCISGTEVTITGGHVEAKNNDINGMAISGSEITITGGQVEAIGGSNGCGIFNWINDITLGWTDNSDYIKASSYKVFSNGSVKIAAGKRFVAYNPVGEGETELAASGIIGDATSTSAVAIDSDPLASKTLRPLDGYYVAVPTGTIVNGKTEADGKTPKPDFTIDGIPHYIFKTGDNVTFTLEDRGQDGVKVDGLPIDLAVTDRVPTIEFQMRTDDINVTAQFYIENTGVDYLDWDDNQKKLVEKNTKNLTPAPKVWLLDGTETTLGTDGIISAPTEAWYIAKGNLSYDHQLKNASHCDIHLILADGCNMTVGTEESPIAISHAIKITDASLTIYGQSTGDNMGKLNAIGNSCGIFVCRYFGKTPDLTINGGQITARGYYAINTFIEEDGSIGGITINGGKVTANGTGSGIYASGNGSSTISILTINGGEVFATNSDEHEGSINSDDHVIITGGHVEAKNNHNYGTAIYCNQSMTITGGQVEATGGSNGYGLYTFFDDITFGWTDYSDYIKANSYCPGFTNKDVKLVEGKYFLIEGTNTVLGSADADYVLSDDDLEAVKGKKLLPIVGMSTGGVKYLAFTDNDGNRKLAGDDVQVYVIVGYDLAKGKAYLKAVEGNVIPKGLPVVIGNKTEDDDLPANIFILGGDDSQTTVEGLLKNYVSCDGTQTVQAYLDKIFGEGASLSEYIPYLLTGGTFKSVDVKATDVIKKDVCLLFIPKWDVLMGKSAGTTNASTRSIGIGNGEATDIETTNFTNYTNFMNEAGAQYYDLLGRKIKKPTKKGVYILNGKKVIR